MGLNVLNSGFVFKEELALVSDFLKREDFDTETGGLLKEVDSYGKSLIALPDALDWSQIRTVEGKVSSMNSKFKKAVLSSKEFRGYCISKLGKGGYLYGHGII